jgi:pimeloyl-ACP methyl ester carboxylesterase
MKKSILFTLCSAAMLMSCSDSIENEEQLEKKNDSNQTMIEIEFPKRDTLFSVDYNGFPFDVQVKVPNGAPKGSILVLQGWNFPITDWCDSTSLCEKALNDGYILVFPDLGKSIYSEKMYPETIQGWRDFPTRKWLREDVIGKLQTEFNLFLEDGNNFVMGLSTGGRGALFMALELPKVFDGCATLSGDYDQFMFPNDNLYKGYFGPMKPNQERWQGMENPTKFIGGLQVPLYVGHGLQDNIVPYRHLELLKEHLDYYEMDLRIVYHTDSTAKHDYLYWNSEVDPVLNFFNELGEK